jgi:hypothetical protein
VACAYLRTPGLIGRRLAGQGRAKSDQKFTTRRMNFFGCEQTTEADT